MITSASQTADATPVTAAPRNVEQIRSTQKTQRDGSRHHAMHSITYTSSLMI